MTERELILETMRRMGKACAEAVQAKAASMSGTELNAEEDYIPSFAAACAKQNMLERPIGFVCKSTEGRVVKLVQPYDSAIYTAEPEELPAQWGFVWSNDPAKARPFIALSTSPYMEGNCCEENGDIFRSKENNNVHAPSAWPQGWEKVEL